MNKSISINLGSGFFTFLTLLFITLKLLHVIDWSWWYVLLPTWLPITVVLACLAIAGMLGLFFAIYDTRKRK